MLNTIFKSPCEGLILEARLRGVTYLALDRDPCCYSSPFVVAIPFSPSFATSHADSPVLVLRGCEPGRIRRRNHGWNDGSDCVVDFLPVDDGPIALVIVVVIVVDCIRPVGCQGDLESEWQQSA